MHSKLMMIIVSGELPALKQKHSIEPDRVEMDLYHASET